MGLGSVGRVPGFGLPANEAISAAVLPPVVRASVPTFANVERLKYGMRFVLLGKRVMG